jgi:hypothetical protein
MCRAVVFRQVRANHPLVLAELLDRASDRQHAPQRPSSIIQRAPSRTTAEGQFLGSLRSAAQARSPVSASDADDHLRANPAVSDPPSRLPQRPQSGHDIRARSPSRVAAIGQMEPRTWPASHPREVDGGFRPVGRGRSREIATTATGRRPLCFPRDGGAGVTGGKRRAKPVMEVRCGKQPAGPPAKRRSRLPSRGWLCLPPLPVTRGCRCPRPQSAVTCSAEAWG